MALDSIRAHALTTDPYRTSSAPTCDRNGCSATTERTVRAFAYRPARSRGTGSVPKTAHSSAMEAAASPVIEVRDVTKRYRLGKNNDVHALRSASVTIERGEMVAIVGPSGSGKSTLMHLIGCLDTPDSGRIHINGRRVDTLRGSALTKLRGTEIGFIFQGFNLVPTMSAIENVALAAEYAGVPRGEALRRSAELLELVGLGSRAKHLPSELSGGQQQRVAIARALVNRPALVLGDEPTGDLDSATSDEIVALMRRINVETGTTFVIVTHNPEVAEACDRTISMRDGSVADDGIAAAAAQTCCAEPSARRDRTFAPLSAPAIAPA